MTQIKILLGFIFLNLSAVALVPILDLSSKFTFISILNVLIILSLFGIEKLYVPNKYIQKIKLHVFGFIEFHSLTILAIWIFCFLFWTGVVLFSDPYRAEIAQGDSMFFTQTLWNLVHGLKPESSIFTFNGLPLAPTDDPRYANTYGYVSIFTLHHYWFPMLVLTPLYALFPEPPMNIFAVQIIVLVIGLPGIYWGVRQIGGGRLPSLLFAVGYSLLPQLDSQLFFKGYFDFLTLGTMPWFVFGLYANKRLVTCFAALLLGLNGYSFAPFLILMGFAQILFFHDRLLGILVVLIGITFMAVSGRLYDVALSAYYQVYTGRPSFFRKYILEADFNQILLNLKFQVSYFLYLLQGLAFLPILALLGKRSFYRITIGFWFIFIGIVFLMIWRNVAWEFQRNSLLIVPVYCFSIIAFFKLSNVNVRVGANTLVNKSFLPGVILMVCFLTNIFIAEKYYRPRYLESHMPWGGNGFFMNDRKNVLGWSSALKRLDEIVPKSESMAWRSSMEVQAFLANRQNSWYAGRAPKEVKYYVFIGEPSTDLEREEWSLLIQTLEKDKNIRLIAHENPGMSLIVYENLESRPVYRDERIIGWGVLSAFFWNREGLIGLGLLRPAN
jgi:hypothetical protein